jgi:hypothetical protein
VIDLTDYQIPSARASTLRWRPVGLGLMGLQDLFFQLFDAGMAAAVGDMLDEAIACEAQFAEDPLGGGMAGLTVAAVRPYLEFCGDQRLATLGLPRRYGAKNPLAFMDCQDVQGSPTSSGGASRPTRWE